MQRFIVGLILVSGSLVYGCGDSGSTNVVEDVSAEEIADFKETQKAAVEEAAKSDAEFEAANAAAQKAAQAGK